MRRDSLHHDRDVIRKLDAFAGRDELTSREFLDDKICGSLNGLGENGLGALTVEISALGNFRNVGELGFPSMPIMDPDIARMMRVREIP